MNQSKVRKIAILGNHTPRQCGIATFTADLAKSIVGAASNLQVDVIAMNDEPGYRYPFPVVASINAENVSEYREMADRLNRGGYDVLCIQHEFGIFGGECGAYLLELVRNVKIPVVTTLHTILRNPSEAQRCVFEELLHRSDKVIVMSRKGAEILRETYRTPDRKIRVVPHGIRDVDHRLGEELRETYHLTHRPLILTFGLLSPDKGIHDMITAMSSVVNRFPEAAYVVLGATHPKIKEHHGESYRESLERRCAELGLENNVFFLNRFVTDRELAGWLAAADIYITPYLKAEQITSGTLAYAVGGGNAVISTPYWHAEELLDRGRGVLVPFADSSAYAQAINGLLINPKLRSEIGARAFEYGRSMRWEQVGQSYLGIFESCQPSTVDLTKIALPLERAVVQMRGTSMPIAGNQV